MPLRVEFFDYTGQSSNPDQYMGQHSELLECLGVSAASVFSWNRNITPSHFQLNVKLVYNKLFKIDLFHHIIIATKSLLSFICVAIY